MYPQQQQSRLPVVLNVVIIMLLLVFMAASVAGQEHVSGPTITYVTVTAVVTMTDYSTVTSISTINSTQAQNMTGGVISKSGVVVPGAGSGSTVSFSFTLLAHFSTYALNYQVYSQDVSNSQASVNYVVGSMSGTLTGEGSTPITDAFQSGNSYVISFTANQADTTLTFSITGK